jgi:hypothetical protein
MILASTCLFVTAQTLIPGMHGISIVPGLKFTWIIVSSDNEISMNLRYNGTQTPPVSIIVTALTKNNKIPIGGSQVLNAGWPSPNSLVLKVNGSSSLYDADLITVYASPYGAPIFQTPQVSTNTQTTSEFTNETSSYSSNSQSSNGNCDPSYPDFCIAPPPPTLNCSDIIQKGFTVLSPDRHDLDRDGDGIGCQE